MMCSVCQSTLCFCELITGVSPSERLMQMLLQLRGGLISPQEIMDEIAPVLATAQDVQLRLGGLPDLGIELQPLFEAAAHVAERMTVCVSGVVSGILAADLPQAWEHLRRLAEAEAFLASLQSMAQAQLAEAMCLVEEEAVELGAL